MNLRDRTIPVFISPSELTFYVGSHSTHKQLLTVYNPYDFPVKYQVFGNTVDKYGVVDPKGTIGARSCIDLLVRHNVPIQANCHAKDKFMITLQDAATNQVIGKRCVLATLLPGEKDTSSSLDDHSSYSACETSLTRERPRTNEGPNGPVKQYFIVLSILFIILLILPTKCEEKEESSIPSYLHIAVPVKIIISYILGLITMALLKP